MKTNILSCFFFFRFIITRSTFVFVFYIFYCQNTLKLFFRFKKQLQKWPGIIDNSEMYKNVYEFLYTIQEPLQWIENNCKNTIYNFQNGWYLIYFLENCVVITVTVVTFLTIAGLVIKLKINYFYYK